jgi:hypothetical protein
MYLTLHFNQLIMCREIVAVYCEDHKEHIYILRPKFRIFNLEQLVYILITVL